MGIPSWLGIAGGILAAGKLSYANSTIQLPDLLSVDAGIIIVTCCNGRQLWRRCVSRCWQLPSSNHQAAYAQIQALRHQLHELQSHIDTE